MNGNEINKEIEAIIGKRGEKVVEIIADFFDIPNNELKRHTKVESLTSSLFDEVNLSFDLEDNLGIEFDDRAAQRFVRKDRTVMGYVRVVKDFLKEKFEKGESGVWILN